MAPILFFRKVIKMPPKNKQYIDPVNQEKLLEDFYNHLKDDTLLWNEFLSDNDDDVSDCELMSADGGSNDDNREEIGGLVNDGDVPEVHASEASRKEKFVNNDEIMVLDNFDNLLPQEQNVFHYSDAKATFITN